MFTKSWSLTFKTTAEFDESPVYESLKLGTNKGYSKTRVRRPVVLIDCIEAVRFTAAFPKGSFWMLIY